MFENNQKMAYLFLEYDMLTYEVVAIITSNQVESWPSWQISVQS